MKTWKKNSLLVISLILVALISVSVFLNVGKNKTEKYKCNDGEEVIYNPLSEENISDSNGLKYVNNEILVYIDSSDSEKALEKYLDNIDAKIVGQIPQINQYQIQLSKEKSLEKIQELVKKMEKISWVNHVGVNYVFETSEDFYPNDKEWEGFWRDNAGGKNWGMEAIKAPKAWEYRDKMNTVNVGVFDTSFDAEHEDLKDVFVEEPLSNFTAKKNKDGNKSHGTHVAGTIAADFDNKIGVCGVCPTARLYGVAYQSKYMSNYTTTQLLNIGFNYLIINDCRVINTSFSSLESVYGFCASRNNEFAIKTIKDVSKEVGYYLECMLNKGYKFVICNASGNINEENGVYQFYRKENFNDKTELSYYDYEDFKRYNEGKADETVKKYFDKYGESRAESGNVDAKYEVLCAIENKKVQDIIITVGSVEPGEKDDNGNIKTYKESAYSQGGEAVDVVAPGGSKSIEEDAIYSTVPGGYGYNQGTSMAAPHVSGVAAMIFASDPDIEPSRVKEIIVETASGEYGSGEHKYGLIDANAAVRAALKIIDRDNLVTDAFKLSYDDGYGNTSTYLIPKINLYSKEVKKLNKEIYDKLYEMIENANKSLINYGTPDGCTDIKYNWHIYDDILCLDISYSYLSGDEPHMYYNIDINNGTILTNDMILEKKGITRDEFIEMAEKIVTKDIFDHTMDVNIGLKSYKGILEQVDIANAPVFLDENGDLCFFVTLWYPENGTSFMLTFKCEDIDFTLPTANEPKDSKINVSDTNKSENNNTSDDISYICNLVQEHYNTVLDTDIFTTFESESSKTNEGYRIILRSTGGNSANVLVGTVEVNTTTGEVSTDSLDVDNWYYK